jgi:hypothetical protein
VLEVLCFYAQSISPLFYARWLGNHNLLTLGVLGFVERNASPHNKFCFELPMMQRRLQQQTKQFSFIGAPRMSSLCMGPIYPGLFT